MAYSGVFVFGDSLVDSGNVLKLANFYGSLPFSDLPEGAPYASDGYFKGRFADGYTFADLISNKLIGQTTDPIFPYNFRDPWIGAEINPFASDPQGNNLNFAYGGAQILQGGEIVPDLDGQTDTFKDAVDGDPDPNALYLFTIGGNDVRSLAPADDDPTGILEAHARLDAAAQKLLGELSGLVGRGIQDIVIVGIPEVGLIPAYDVDDIPGLQGVELERSQAATDYSAYLDNLLRTVVVRGLEDLGANVIYVPIADFGPTPGALSLILPTLAALHDLTIEDLTDDLLAHADVVFFDNVHPTGQVHALVGSYMMSLINGTPWIEILPMADAVVDFRAAGSIVLPGEVDVVTVALAAGTTYRFDLLGISSIGNFGDLADPLIRILSPNGVVLGFDDDSGAGFDSTISFTAPTSGTYAIQLTAIGEVTGNYSFEASLLSGAAATGGNTYAVSSASTLVLEHAGSPGEDVVAASVSYALAQGSAIEVLRTNNDNGKTAINLTGNEFAQTLIGNAGSNVLNGRGGSDIYYGGGGSDRFVIGSDALGNPAAADRIMDYARGETVDLTAVLSVASGINVSSGGFLRVTTSGLIQVDANGSGNEWTTVATINSVKGSVTFSYISGGSPTSVSLNRVADGPARSAGATNSTMMAIAAGVTAIDAPLTAADVSAQEPVLARYSLADHVPYLSDGALEGSGNSATLEGNPVGVTPIASTGRFANPIPHAPLEASEPLEFALSPLAIGTDIGLPASLPTVAAKVQMADAEALAIPELYGLARAIDQGEPTADLDVLLAALPASGGAIAWTRGADELAFLSPVTNGAEMIGSLPQPFEPGMSADTVVIV